MIEPVSPGVPGGKNLR